MDESAKPQDIEAAVDEPLSDGDAEAQTEVVRREAGVRLRTNIQSGSASERVNVTLETHARDIPDLIDQLPSYQKVLSENLDSARRQAEVDDE